MDTGMFKTKAENGRMQRAELEVRRMGYEFYAPSIHLSSENNKLTIQLKLQNRGVAPFYYDWTGEYGLIANAKVYQSNFTTENLKDFCLVIRLASGRTRLIFPSCRKESTR